jgi:hypothetical protein
MSNEPYVLFYVTRSDTGTPDQFWGCPDKPVYLTDHWIICWGREEAIEEYEKLFADECELDVHCAGIAPIDPEYKTDWC